VRAPHEEEGRWGFIGGRVARGLHAFASKQRSERERGGAWPRQRVHAWLAGGAAGAWRGRTTHATRGEARLLRGEVRRGLWGTARAQ
jgi:hypothetical protein